MRAIASIILTGMATYAIPELGADNWSIPVDLSGTTQEQNIFNNSVAVDDAGNGYAVWVQGDGISYSVNAAQFDAWSSSWSEPVVISLGDADSPQIAVTHDGHAIAVWRRTDWSVGYAKIEYSTFQDGFWSDGATIDNLNPSWSDEQFPQVGVDAYGNAVAVWQAGGQPGSVIRAATYNFVDDVWYNISDISVNESNVRNHPTLAVNDSGEAVAVWELFDTFNNVFGLEANRYIYGSWQGVESIPVTSVEGVATSCTLASLYPKVAIDNASNIAVVWTLWNPSTYEFTINTSRRSSYNDWNYPFTLSGYGNFSTPSFILADIGLDNSGEAVVVWALFDEANNLGIIQSRVYQNGQWSNDTTDLTSECVQSALCRIAVNGSGDAYVTYVSRATVEDIPYLSASRYNKGTNSWTLPQVLTDPTVIGAYFPTVTVNELGDAFIIWFATDFLGSTNPAVGNIMTTNVVGHLDVLPPSWVDGEQVTRYYVVDEDIVNIIFWGASFSDDIVAYQVYRDGQLIAIVSSNTFEFADHYRNPYESNTYQVFALNSSGALSAPVSITLP